MSHDFSQGRLHAGLAQRTSCVALAWHIARGNTPIRVTSSLHHFVTCVAWLGLFLPCLVWFGLVLLVLALLACLVFGLPCRVACPLLGWCGLAWLTLVVGPSWALVLCVGLAWFCLALFGPILALALLGLALIAMCLGFALAGFGFACMCYLAWYCVGLVWPGLVLAWLTLVVGPSWCVGLAWFCLALFGLILALALLGLALIAMCLGFALAGLALLA